MDLWRTEGTWRCFYLGCNAPSAYLHPSQAVWLVVFFSGIWTESTNIRTCLRFILCKIVPADTRICFSDYARQQFTHNANHVVFSHSDGIAPLRGAKLSAVGRDTQVAEDDRSKMCLKGLSSSDVLVSHHPIPQGGILAHDHEGTR